MSLTNKIKQYNPEQLLDELIDEIVRNKDWEALGTLLKIYRHE